MKKDAYVTKILSELGFKEEHQLTPEQEAMFQTALDPEERELDDMLRLLKKQERNS